VTVPEFTLADLFGPESRTGTVARRDHAAEAENRRAMLEKLHPAPDPEVMRMDQVALILTKLVNIDGRQITRETVRAWWSLLGHLEIELCLKAVDEFYLRNTRRMTPGDLQDMVGGHLDEPAWRPHV
jgi:hypothetical protein